jgi:uncharacterized membrane protein YiaA
MNNSQAPSSAFIFASWAAMLIGIVTYLIGLYNVDLELANKGYFLVVLLYSLFAAVSVQKSVRDKLENIQVSSLYISISWFALISGILFLVIGLWNTTVLDVASRGFYGMAFVLSLFAAIAVQKNVRDTLAANRVPK